MGQRSRDLDFPEKTLGAKRGGQSAMHDLDSHRSLMAGVPREIDGGHRPTPDLALERVTVAQGFRQ
jgi:hypothetical protein